MKMFRILAVSMFLAGFSACQEPDAPWDPSWNTPGNTETPETKEPKPRDVWIDCAANFADYANDRDRIASDLARIKNVGFTDVNYISRIFKRYYGITVTEYKQSFEMEESV